MKEVVICLFTALFLSTGDSPKKYLLRQESDMTECWFVEQGQVPRTRIKLPLVVTRSVKSELPFDLFLELEAKNAERTLRFISQYPHIDIDESKTTVRIEIRKILQTSDDYEIHVGNELRTSLTTGAIVSTRMVREVYRYSKKRLTLVEFQPYGCTIL